MNPIAIVELEEDNKKGHDALGEFAKKVWLAADKEHYGDTIPDFTRHKFTLVAREHASAFKNTTSEISSSEDILGYIMVTIDTGVALVQPLMVKTELKGRGIGTQLMQAAEKKAKDLGAHKMCLETGVDWKAKDFYLKNGYAVRAVLPNHYGHYDSVLMDKMLD